MGEITIPPTPVNAALSALLAAEARLLRHVSLPFGSSLLALACSGGGDDPGPSGPVPSVLVKSSGDDQQGLPGAALPQPLEVRVTDQSGLVMANVLVTFSASAGTVNPTSASTDTQGRARTLLTLPNQAAAQIAYKATRDLASIRDARVLVVMPPAVRGLGSSSGFNFVIKDMNGLGHQALLAATNTFLTEARKRPELTNLRMRMADGKEVPAMVALRDTDLDLAFLRPVDALAAPAAFRHPGTRERPSSRRELAALYVPCRPSCPGPSPGRAPRESAFCAVQRSD